MNFYSGIEPTHIIYKDKDETVTFQFAGNLPLGEAQLYIVYNGVLNDKLVGFYRSKYKTPSGEERFSGVTQFEVNVNLLYACSLQ